MGRIVSEEGLCEGAKARVWRQRTAVDFGTWPDADLAQVARFRLRSWGDLPRVAGLELERRARLEEG